MKLAIIIVTWNSANEIAACLDSLKSAQVQHEIWVVDNNSSDDTVNIVSSQFPDVRLVSNTENVGFAKANNQAIAQTTSDYVLILNPDTLVIEGTVERALEEIEARPQVGLLGVKTLNADRSLQASCFRFPTLRMNVAEQFNLHYLFPLKARGRIFLSTFWDHSTSRSVDWVLGAFMLVKRSAIEKAGNLPEQYYMYGEDLDWCYQICKAGYQVWFASEASLVHYGNKSGEQLSLTWGIQKRTESKYMFCRAAYGVVNAKLIELTDLVGQTLRRALYTIKIRRDPSLRSALEGIKTSQKVAFDHIFRNRS